MLQDYPTKTWKELDLLLQQYSRFLVSSHIHPDGDAIGASLAFKRGLQKIGKDVQWMMNEDPGRMFHKFYSKDELIIYAPNETDFSDREVLVMVDANEWSRMGELGEAIKNHPGEKVCIDHHYIHNHVSEVQIVDTDSPSTTVILYRMMKHLGVELTKEIAEPIYLGMIVDTQNFHLPNTTEESHLVAAECLRVGVEPFEVYEPVYGITSFPRLRLMSEVFNTLEIHFDGRIGLMYTTQDMFDRAGAQERDDEGFSDLVRTIEGVSIGIYLREEPNGKIKVSWRAKGDNNVVVSAQKFGGGGHIRAAGCTIYGSLQEIKKEVLKNMEQRFANGEIS